MFGVLVAIGVIVGDRIVVRAGVQRGLDARDIKFLNARIVIGGFIVAHLVSVIFYFPERIKESPCVLINFWAGLSSFGGFLGACWRSSTTRARRRSRPCATPTPSRWASRSAGSSAAPAASRPTITPAPHDFFLAVRYPDGPRHDLGLDELLFTIVMTAILFWYARKTARPRPRHRALRRPVRAGALRPRLPARDRRRAPRRALRRPDPGAVGLLLALALGLWLLRRPGEPAALLDPGGDRRRKPAASGQAHPVKAGKYRRTHPSEPSGWRGVNRQIAVNSSSRFSSASRPRRTSSPPGPP